ncbi:hypothetical protein CLOM_g18692 [Closterium sp. NIES-68]|nr:hypothetical protein CLOM_g18692 [Closterium sp. NIES-68]
MAQHDNRSTTSRQVSSSSSFRREAARTFQTIDLDRDGKISAHELATVLKRLNYGSSKPLITCTNAGGCDESSRVAEEDLIRFAEDVIHEADVDGDGVIDFEEFLLSARAGPSLMGEFFVSVPSSNEDGDESDGGSDSDEDEMEGDLFRAFEVFDLDGNGVICAEELRFVVGVLSGDELTKEDCERMIKRVDNNGDGRVDYTEFKIMMAGVFA